jgi:hypothetical protein
VSVLEDRYRKVLRVLPAAYHATWEEEMWLTGKLTWFPDPPAGSAQRHEWKRRPLRRTREANRETVLSGRRSTAA